MISETQEQEIDQVAGHSLLSFPDMQPVQVPKMSNIVRVLFSISLALFILGILTGLHDSDGFTGTAVFGLLSAGIYYISSTKRNNKKKNEVADVVMDQVNQRFGTTFANDPRQLFVGKTHARDERFKTVALVFDSKKRKLLVLAHHGLLEDKPLAFVEDYDYIRSVEFSSKGGSTTSGVVGRGALVIPIHFSTANTNEIAILLKDTELVEARLSIYGQDKEVADKFRQLSALINP